MKRFNRMTPPRSKPFSFFFLLLPAAVAHLSPNSVMTGLVCDLPPVRYRFIRSKSDRHKEKSLIHLCISKGSVRVSVHVIRPMSSFSFCLPTTCFLDGSFSCCVNIFSSYRIGLAGGSEANTMSASLILFFFFFLLLLLYSLFIRPLYSQFQPLYEALSKDVLKRFPFASAPIQSPCRVGRVVDIYG